MRVDTLSERSRTGAAFTVFHAAGTAHPRTADGVAFAVCQTRRTLARAAETCRTCHRSAQSHSQPCTAHSFSRMTFAGTARRAGTAHGSASGRSTRPFFGKSGIRTRGQTAAEARTAASAPQSIHLSDPIQGLKLLDSGGKLRSVNSGPGQGTHRASNAAPLRQHQVGGSDHPCGRHDEWYRLQNAAYHVRGLLEERKRRHRSGIPAGCWCPAPGSDPFVFCATSPPRGALYSRHKGQRVRPATVGEFPEDSSKERFWLPRKRGLISSVIPNNRSCRAHARD